MHPQSVERQPSAVKSFGGGLRRTERGSPMCSASSLKRKKKLGWQDDSDPTRSVSCVMKDVGGCLELTKKSPCKTVTDFFKGNMQIITMGCQHISNSFFFFSGL